MLHTIALLCAINSCSPEATKSVETSQILCHEWYIGCLKEFPIETCIKRKAESRREEILDSVELIKKQISDIESK